MNPMKSTAFIPNRTLLASAKNGVYHACFGLTVFCCFTSLGKSSVKAEGLGPLSDYVFSGDVDGWSGSTEKGVYWLENKEGDAGDIRYFYTPVFKNGSNKRSAKIEVITTGMHKDARAGLLYGYRESPRFYYLIVASTDGAIEIYKRDGSNFQLTQSSSSDSKNSGSAQIEVKEAGRELSVIFNGRTIATLENNNIGKGALGIAAFGLGRFGFADYQQGPSGAKPSTEKASDALPKESKERQVEPRTNGPITEPKPRGKLVYLDYRDPKKRMVQYRSPFPGGWSFDQNPNDKLSLTGPNGVEVYQTESAWFFYSNDPFARESAQKLGRPVAPVMPLATYLQKQFAPYMEQRGFKITKQYPMPRIVDFWEIYASTMPQGLSRKQFDSIGVEWENRDGSRALTILLLWTAQNESYVTWNVSASELYAPKGAFENAKNAYVYGSINTEVNPAWQIAMNKDLIAQIMKNRKQVGELTRQSQIQHIGRMNAILARGQASAQVAKINSDILDISHAGYLKRSDMVSTGQSKSINGIGEHSVIGNANTGERYRVETGHSNYWVNGNGEYFSTDDSLYDPRRDRSISDQRWEQFEVIK